MSTQEILDSFFESLVEEIRSRKPEYLRDTFTVAEIYQNLVPYRTHRDRIGVEMNADYEDALLRLLAGEGDLLVLESEAARREIQEELKSSNPNTMMYREYAAAMVRLNPALGIEPEDIPVETWEEAARSGFEGDGAEDVDEAIDIGELAPSGSEAVAESGELEDPEEADDLEHGGTAPALVMESDDQDEGEESFESPEEEDDGKMIEFRVAGFSIVEETEPTEETEENGATEETEAVEEEWPEDDYENEDKDDDDEEPTLGDLVGADAEPAEAPTEIGETPLGASSVDQDAGIAGKNDGADHCRSCKAELPGRAVLNFCPFCGTDQRLVPCPSCEEEMEPDWLFCVACGTEMPE